MANNGDAIPGAIARAIDRINDPRFLAIIVMVSIFLIYSSATANPTLGVITVIVGIGAIMVFSISERPNLGMRVAFDFPKGLKDPVHIEKCSYQLFEPGESSPKDSGSLYPVRGPGGDYICALPQKARSQDMIKIVIRLEGEHDENWRVEDFEPDLLWPRVSVRSTLNTIGVNVIVGGRVEDSTQTPKSEASKEGIIQLRNFARPIQNKPGYFQWKVFADASKEILPQIEKIEYILHPTFGQTRRIRENPADNFALESTGWGEFTILAHVTFKDGRVETISHHLNLKNPWPQDPSR